MSINDYVKLNFELDNDIKSKKYSHIISGKLATYLEELLKALNHFKDMDYQVNDIYYLRLKEFSQTALDNIYINNFRTYDKADTSIELAKHMLTISLKHDDFDPMIVGFYDLKDDLDKLEIIL